MVRVARATVVGRGTDTTVQHHIRGHTSAEILQRGKASASHTRAFARNTLNALQRLQVQTIVIAIGNDQVGLVSATDQLHSNRVHVLLNVRSRHRSATIGDTRVGNRTPERPRCPVDAAVSTRGRRIRHSSREASQVLTSIACAVAIQVTADAVSKLGFSNHHAAIEQVDDRFLARVLDHLQTRDRHSSSVLRDRELSRRDGAVLRHVQDFIARVAVGVVGGGIGVSNFLKDYVTTRKRFDVSTLFQTTQQCVVVRHVISKFTSAALNVGRNDVADTGIGKCHFRYS